jgi:hypothetical protein
MLFSTCREVRIEFALVILSLATVTGLPGQENVAAHPAGPVIPAISGTVVDAITGKPVVGVDVILRAETSDRRTQLRYESCRTSPLGRFSFPSSVTPDEIGGLFASGIGEIAITVNIPFVPLARLRAVPGNDWVTSDAGSDASGYVLVDPLFQSKSTYGQNLATSGPRVNNKTYFPMAVQFLRACEQEWNANCLSMDATRDVQVPLIPVLADLAGCKKITDRDLSRGCQQLQTYRAAFRHVETMAQVRAGKELCNSLDGGRISGRCLEYLHAYVLRVKDYEDRPPLRMEIAPVEEALILTPIAGMPVGTHGRIHEDAFDETATYFASYHRANLRATAEAARVTVEFMGNADRRRLYWTSLLKMQVGPAKQPGHFEMFDGSPLFMAEMDYSSDVLWSSGDKLVRIAFHHVPEQARQFSGEEAARMEEVTPELRRELIRSYLRKYPVSN